MRLLNELMVDEPADGLQAQGIAAVIYCEEESWCVGLEPMECRALAKRLLELAADHERERPQVRQ